MVAIGPTTANALSAAGIQRIARAADTTTKAVIEALEGHLARTKKRSEVGVKRSMSFPTQRPRRLRRSEALRGLVRETRLSDGGLDLSDVCLPGNEGAQGSQFDAGRASTIRGRNC